ncbi:MAG: TonB-dependent receptor [Prevotella sp.]|nr:TonB-dependent receptor [Prevotella sp.]
MKKKLKLIVMALCLAPMAFAQTDDTKQQEQNTIADEQAFTFTEAQLGEDDDMSQNVSIISSNQNIYASKVGFQFSPVRFRYRAFNQKYNEIYINGVQMNDMESGQFRFSLIGGLNRVTNNSREASLPFEATNYAMSAMGGSNNYDFRPSHMRTGQHASIAGANRNYTLRGVYAYNSGLRPDGWAFSANVTYRWANMETAYIEGTFYNSLSYYFGAEKKLNDQHAISFVTWGNPTERAGQGASTDEMYWLANNRYYNPYWGYQNGKKRSSRIVNDFAPSAMLTWDWNINEKSKLSTVLSGRYSIYKNTRLNYNDVEKPQADYWKNMPSSYYDVWYSEDKSGRTEAGYNDFWRARDYLMSSKANRQLNFDRMYYANQQIAKNGGDAVYFIQAKHNNNLNLALASTFKTELSKNTVWNMGFQLATNKGMHYQTMEDLLGAEKFSNLNTYAVSKYPAGDDHIYYDLNNKDGVVKEGDRFGYDYNILVNKAQFWTSLRYTKGRLHSFVAGRIGSVSMQRDGKMLNGVANATGVSSYGKSGTARFLEGGGKAGLAYLFGKGHTITLGAGYELKAPQPQSAFISPEVNNDFVFNLKNEKVFSSELGYQFETSWLKANVNGYYSYLTDVTEWQNFFYDDLNSFSYVSMTGIKKAYYGVEWGLNIKLTPSFTIRTIGTVSEAKNMNNSNVVYMHSTEGTYHSDIVYNKNMREAGTPLTALGLTLSYNAKGWFIDLSGNYYDRIYLSYSPSYRYGKTLDNRQKSYENTGIAAEKVFDKNEAGDKVLLSDAIAQEKGKGGFMLDLSIGRSIRMKKGNLSINLSITNLLNNQNMVTGGYEQSRSNYSVTENDDAKRTITVGNARVYKFDRNPMKFYAYGINGMLNIGYNF